MQKEKKSPSKLMIWGLALSVTFFFAHYLFIEEWVHENRLTYSVSADDYQNYVDSLDDYYSGNFSLSPNFESIADSLIDKGIRRFELKQFRTGISSYEEIGFIYFPLMKVPKPELITNRFVSRSKPLKRSLGISILTLSIFLLVDYFAFFKRR